MFIYVCAYVHFRGDETAKIGITKNPEKRFKQLRWGYGPVYPVKYYQMKSREAAISLETFICRSFNSVYKREWLDISPADLCAFVEKNLAIFNGYES